jgi:hypothetical protein
MPKFRMLAKQVGDAVYDVASDGSVCPPGSCPTVIMREDGKLIVVGKHLRGSSRTDLDNAGLVKVYEDEEAIVIDEAMLRTAYKALSA